MTERNRFEHKQLCVLHVCTQRLEYLFVQEYRERKYSELCQMSCNNGNIPPEGAKKQIEVNGNGAESSHQTFITERDHEKHGYHLSLHHPR